MLRYLIIMECMYSFREHAIMTAVVTHRKHVHLNFFEVLQLI